MNDTYAAPNIGKTILSLRSTRPYTYICSAFAQKAELKVVGVLEVRTWGGAGVSALVCTRGAAFKMDWWKFGCVSVDTTILHTFLSAPACTACTDMVYSKELERDVTTTAMAKLGGHLTNSLSIRHLPSHQ